MMPQDQKIKRISLPHGIRHEVFRRDSYKCTECGANKDQICLHIDHIIPISRGGTDELSNLRTLCQTCNLEKSDLIHQIKKETVIIQSSYLTLEPQDIKGSCCTEKSTSMITFDCGPDGFETYLVCDKHYSEEAWSRFAVSTVEIKH